MTPDVDPPGQPPSVPPPDTEGGGHLQANDQKGSTTTEGRADVGTMGNDNVVAGFYQEGGETSIYIAEMFAQGEFGSEASKLTIEHFTTLAWDSLGESTEDIVCDDLEVHRIVEALRQRHVLLLEGMPELGKRHLALKISAELGSDSGIEKINRLRLPLSRNLRVNFDRLLEKGKHFDKSVIIIENAFHYENRDLLGIAKDMDAAARDALRRRLEKSKSWLILTYDADRQPILHPAMRELRQEVLGPQPKQLLGFYKRCVQATASSATGEGGEQKSKLAKLCETEQAQRVVEALPTAPRIERFVKDYLSKIVGGDLSLEQALAQAESLDSWLLDDIAGDLGALAYVLALTICHSSPHREPVRWYEFEVMRRHLENHLRAELGGEQKEPRSPRELCTERDLLRRLQVEIVSHPEGDVVRFADEKRADRLWKTLLGEGRQLAGLLIPWLEELAKEDKLFLRRRAGWALGVLGQIDQSSVFGRIFSVWSAQSDELRRPRKAAFGALVQSAYVNPSLRDFCRRLMKDALHDIEIAPVRSGIFALAELGRIDLAAAVEMMEPIVRKWLVPRLAGLEEIEEERRRQAKSVREATGSYFLGSKRSKIFNEALENDLYSDMPFVFPPKREFRILMAIQSSLTGLFFTMGAVPVLRELNLWFSVGKAELSSVLTLLYLRPQGIAEVLERFVFRRVGDTGKEEWWSPVLLSALTDDNGAEILAKFLVEIYLGACRLPNVFERALVAHWLVLIEHWSRQAAGGSHCRELVIALWCRLLRAPDMELREKLLDLLDHSEFGISGTLLGDLVEEIRRRRAAERAAHARIA